MTAAALIPPARYSQGSLRLMLARVATREARRFAIAALDVHLCEGWLGASGFCMRAVGHDGGCLPIPPAYDPAEVA